jgi:hypothetical protein
VTFAYIQVLWRALKSRGFSIESLDAIFDGPVNILSLFNLEMLRKMKLGWLIALIAW